MGRRALGVALAGFTGAALAVQSRVNGELGLRLQDGVAAAVISFGTGLLVLTLVVVGLPFGRRGLRRVWAALRGGRLRWWQCLGGVCGGFMVASQGLTVAALGVAVFTVALVAGQSSSGLLVDRAGLAPGGAEPVTIRRMVGAVLCVLAVVVAIVDQLATPRTLALAVVPLLAGVGVAWQQAVNGQVRAASGSAWAATFVNFASGMVALLLGFGVGVAAWGWPAGGLPTEPWLYAGGLLGVLVIAIAAAVVRYTGVLLLGLAVIGGQVVGALVLDLVAPAQARPGGATYAGVALALLAVLVAGWVGRPRRWGSRMAPSPQW